MQTYKKLLFAAVIITTVALGSSATGQIIYGQPSSGNIDIVYSHWKLDGPDGESTINQWYIPVTGYVPLADNYEMYFYGANTSNSLDYLNQDYSLNGLNDIRAQFNASFAEDQVLASLGINLPTGKREVNLDDQWIVLDFLSRDFLNFPVRRLGEGLGLDFLFGGATTAGTDIRLGATLEYRYTGTFQPYNTGDDYNPGDVFNISVSADKQSEQWDNGLTLTFGTYSDDQLNDEKVYSVGNMFNINFRNTFKSQNYSFSGYLNYVNRSRNTRYNADGTIYDQLREYGNTFSIGAAYTYHPQKEWYLAPALDLRFIGENERNLGSSDIVGMGLTYGRQLGRTMNGALGMRYYTGSADGGDIDLSGLQFTLSLTTSF